MTALLVHKPGICSTLQDPGRTGYRAYGVPASGALDAVMLRLANVLVANPADCGAIEMLYAGVTIEVRGGAARLAVVGADATIAPSDGGIPRKVPAWQSVTVRAGEILRVGPVRAAAAAYLAVEGGFDVAPVLGSVSTYLRGALGGWHGRALRAGDALPLVQEEATARAERRYMRVPDLRAPDRLRIMPGPQESRFEQTSIDTLLDSDYVVSSSSDRAGLRLEGPVLRHVGGYDSSSEGVAAGTLQVPGSGLPVILIGDHPTVGGYPRIATIISADVPAAGRLRIGSRVRFTAVGEVEAARARTQLTETIEDTIASAVEVQ